MNWIREIRQFHSFDRMVWLELGVGFLIGGIIMTAIFGTLYAFHTFSIDGNQWTPGNFLYWFIKLIPAAWSEEFIYRGILLTGLIFLLRKPWFAVAISSLFFGLSHVFNPHATWISIGSNALGGVMYSIAFLGSRRIWMPMALHFAWNFLQGPVLGFPVSGLQMGGILKLSPLAETYLGGGGYGPEASLIGLAYRIVIILMLWIWFQFLAPNRANRNAEQASPAL